MEEKGGLILMLFMVMPLLGTIQAQLQDYPIANLSIKWINGPNIYRSVYHEVGGSTSIFKALLLRQNPNFDGLGFACGFFCPTANTGNSCSSYIFAVLIVLLNGTDDASGHILQDWKTHMVWSANRDRPVAENATLELTGGGDLILKDADGSLVWSTNTLKKSIVRMNLTEDGNLMLVDGKSKTVWQSFDHPTDCLLSGQKLWKGQRLVANFSSSNWTQGEYFLSATGDQWGLFVNSTPPQIYYSWRGLSFGGSDESYIVLTNGRLDFWYNNYGLYVISLPKTSTLQYMRLESDGHLRVHQLSYKKFHYPPDFVGSSSWPSYWSSWSVKDVLQGSLDDCDYPTVCGRFGICSNGQCTCPQNASGNEFYFDQVNYNHPNLGCKLITELSCQSTQNHRFLILNKVSYFTKLNGVSPYLISQDSCTEKCLKNCSCKGGFFGFSKNTSFGICYLPSEVFSLIYESPMYQLPNTIAFIKVQVSQESNISSSSISDAALASAIVGGLFGFFLIVYVVMVFVKSRKRVEEEDEDEIFDQLLSMPTRFSHDELKVATNNFFHKLGEGGFGSVFKGILEDGTVIAVKRLDNISQGKKEFLSEVKTIGSIHHVNLVRLVGFCTERSSRLLVYEFMCNGSLDKWIFQRNGAQLDWEKKNKIINQVAEGLLYLHEKCRQKIVHLDIKPQNILLDENFDAKVSDFGLSKLMDKDQSHIMTRMRGTPGYMAPEWLTSMITQKADVYSFGVVVVEILCGRRNLDYSRSEESAHLLGMMKDKIDHGMLIDFVREHTHDMEINEKEFVDMIRLAIWCLQGDTSKRPSMSQVVKVLEGTLQVDPDLECNFMNIRPRTIHSNISSPLIASVLSGPR